MIRRYLDDLIITEMSRSWFLLRSQASEYAYLYNNQSCELGVLSVVDDERLKRTVGEVIKSKKIRPKVHSSPSRYLQRKGVPRLMLFLTASCNLKCVYCHCNSNPRRAHMDDDTVFYVLDRYLDHIREVRGSDTHVQITFMGGGEPFLRIKIIKEVVEYIEKQGFRGEYVIVTNGTLGSDSEWEWLRAKGFNITISADGAPRVHDNQRIFAAGGKPTSGKISDRLRHLSGIGADVNIRTTVMDVQAETIDSICEYFKQFPCVKTHHLEPVSFAGRGASLKYMSRDEFYRQFFHNYSKHLYQDPERFKSAWFRPFKKADGFCGAVYFNAVVTHDGFVSLCSEADSSVLKTRMGSKYIVGHIKDDHPFLSMNSLKFSRENSIKVLSKCINCIIRYKCGGGCYIKRDRDFEDTAGFYEAYCRNAIILNMSYLISGINDTSRKLYSDSDVA